MMSIPCTADATMSSPETLSSAVQLLTNAVLSALPDPAAFDKIIGPEHAVRAYTDAWRTLLSQRGSRVRLTDGSFSTRISYITRAALPPAPSAPPAYTCTPAREDDLDALAELYSAFKAESPWGETTTRADALAFLARPVAARLVWVCRVGGAVAAYVLLGRVTPRTIAIRNVYVLQAHRRKGIAEAMVRAVSRYYLGAGSYGLEGAPEVPPTVGFKEEVNLNVENGAAAQRVYKRAGFLLPDGEGEELTGGVDPVTGRKAWYPCIWRAVTLEDAS